MPKTFRKVKTIDNFRSIWVISGQPKHDSYSIMIETDMIRIRSNDTNHHI